MYSLYETDKRDLRKVESHFGAMVSFLTNLFQKGLTYSQRKAVNDFISLIFLLATASRKANKSARFRSI